MLLLPVDQMELDICCHKKSVSELATERLKHNDTVLLQFEFSYFFETGTRRRCYLAPERFLDSGQAAPQPDALQPAMVSKILGQHV